MRPIDKTTARYHTDLFEERYHVDGRSKRLTKRFAKRKSSKAARRALAKHAVQEALEHLRQKRYVTLKDYLRGKRTS